MADQALQMPKLGTRASDRRAPRFAVVDSKVEAPFVAAFEARDGTHEPAWLGDLRHAGLEAFRILGLPNRRIEDWKYTDLRAQLREAFDFADAPTEPPAHPWLDELDGKTHRIEFVDGLLRSGLDALPEGLEVIAMTDWSDDAPAWLRTAMPAPTPDDRRPLLALNTALMQAGVAVRVPKGVQLARPIEFVYAQSGHRTQSQIRVVVVVEEGASVTCVESFVGAGGGFSNSVFDLVLGNAARVDHVKMMGAAADALHVSSLTARIGADAAYDGLYLTEGSALSRHDGRYVVEGDGGSVTVNGAYMLADGRHADVTTVVDHAQPHGTSRQTVHGVLAGRSKGVFQGRVHVFPDAQSTDAHQLSKAILLSEKAEMDAKPELEIYADDVKCAHGATVGELDAQAIFYLRSRGLPLPAAKSLLIEAFLDDIVDHVADGVIKAALKSRIAGWLAEHADAMLGDDS